MKEGMDQTRQRKDEWNNNNMESKRERGVKYNAEKYENK
jgi:hypothetical protein